MTRVPTRKVVLLTVLLALCTSVATPASAAVIGDGDGGTTLDDGLEGEDSTSPGVPGSSDDSETDDSSGDDSTESDQEDSTDEESTEESTDEEASDTNDTSDDGSTGDSDQWSDRSTNGSSTTASNDSDAGRATGENASIENRTLSNQPAPIVAAADVSAGVLEALKYERLLSLSLDDDVDRAEANPTDGDGADPLTARTDDADGTDTVTASLGAGVDTIVDGTNGLITDVSGTITGDATDDDAPPRVDGDRSAGSSTGDATPAGPGADGSGGDGHLPSDSTTGVAVGIGALAVAGVARNGALLPSGIANLGSALAAGLAPVFGRSSALDRLVRTLAPFRYSRYDDSDPLEHDARAEVYEVVNGAPGAYLSKVADRADLPLSTARHHIRVLEREDLVSGAKVRGKRRFYPAYTSGIELAAALDDEATAAVIDAVARFGSASVSDLAAELDRDPSTVSHHLSRLAEDGIVVRERDGRAVNNRLSAEARTALEPGRETGTDAAEAGEALASD